MRLEAVAPESSSGCAAATAGIRSESFYTTSKDFSRRVADVLFKNQTEPPFLSRGILIELENGERVLSFGPYFGTSHLGILVDLQEDVHREFGSPLTQPRIKKILWSGEFEFSKNANEFKLKRANQTSGLVYGVMGQAKKKPPGFESTEFQNDAKSLESFLSANPDLPKEATFHVEDYDKKKKHLLEVFVSEEESLLHNIGNKINGINGLVQLMDADFWEFNSDLIEKQFLPVIRHLQKTYTHIDYLRNDFNLLNELFEAFAIEQKRRENSEDKSLSQELQSVITRLGVTNIQTALKHFNDAAHNSLKLPMSSTDRTQNVYAPAFIHYRR